VSAAQSAPVGTFRRYSEARLSAAKLALIGTLAPIIEEYEAAGYAVTVRQVYYQCVARGLMPSSGKTYDAVQGAIADGRMAGLISWTAIEDRGRALYRPSSWDGPGEMLRGAARQYQRDLWREQEWYPEVWIEKDSLLGVIADICTQLRVPYFSCHGYSSASAQWEAAGRMRAALSRGQRPIVLHLGDHDPSGQDMTRDNRDRLSLFLGTPVMVQRLALHMSQIEELSLPPFWAKVSDPRAGGYIAQYGDQSWELDALPPPYMRSLIEGAVVRLRDQRTWEASLQREGEERRVLEELALDHE